MATTPKRRIIIQDSGSPAANTPHSILNFLGSLAASDAGGGVIDISLGAITNLGTSFVESATLITTALDTDTVATSMTLTPGAGTYWAFFTSTVSVNKNSKFGIVSLYSNGVQVANSERTIGGQSNNLGGFLCLAEITVAGGQAIDARWRVNTTTGGPVATMLDRGLYLLQVA